MLELIEKPGFVYCWINQTNGKAYIGSHWGGHLNDGYTGSGKLFKKAVKKYGVGNFTRFTLCVYKDIPKKYLHKEEQFWINHFHQKWSHGIYNISLIAGGGYQLGNASEDKKNKVNKKISLTQLGKTKDKLRGVPKSILHKENISITLSGRPQKPEIIQKLIKANSGKKQPPQRINTRIIKTNQIFSLKMHKWYLTPSGSFINSIEAAKHNGVSYRTVLNYCNSNTKGYSIRRIK